MTAADFRQAISGLGLTQVAAAQALGINPRTARRYALGGVPSKAVARVRAGLIALDKQEQKS